MLCDEMLGLTQAKKLARDRVLDDEESPARGLTLQDGQISPESWDVRMHNGWCIITVRVQEGRGGYHLSLPVA